MNGNDLDFGIHSYTCTFFPLFSMRLGGKLYKLFKTQTEVCAISHTVIKFLLNYPLAPKFVSLETFSIHMPVVHRIFISV